MCLDGISVFYDGVAAVREVSLSIRRGEVLAVIGPSGCGKTTLLRALNRLTCLPIVAAPPTTAGHHTVRSTGWTKPPDRFTRPHQHAPQPRWSTKRS
jgi:ABC-type glutathione transport system ATPase component